jgi:integrase
LTRSSARSAASVDRIGLVDAAGAKVKVVQKMLGHASAAMTLDIYADLFDDDLEAVPAALDQARSRSTQADMG